MEHLSHEVAVAARDLLFLERLLGLLRCTPETLGGLLVRAGLDGLTIRAVPLADGLAARGVLLIAPVDRHELGRVLARLRGLGVRITLAVATAPLHLGWAVLVARASRARGLWLILCPIGLSQAAGTLTQFFCVLTAALRLALLLFETTELLFQRLALARRLPLLRLLVALTLLVLLTLALLLLLLTLLLGLLLLAGLVFLRLVARFLTLFWLLGRLLLT